MGRWKNSRFNTVRFLRVEMQGIPAIEQHTLVHEVHFDLPLVDKQKLLAHVLLEGFVNEIGRRINHERQHAALPHVMGQHGVPQALVIGCQ